MKVTILFSHLDEVTEAEARELVALCANDGADISLKKDKSLGAFDGLDVVTQISAAGIAITVFALLVVTLYQRIHPAVVVEQQPDGSVVARSDSVLPRGTVVIASQNGDVSLHRPNEGLVEKTVAATFGAQ